MRYKQEAFYYLTFKMHNKCNEKQNINLNSLSGMREIFENLQQSRETKKKRLETLP